MTSTVNSELAAHIMASQEQGGSETACLVNVLWRYRSLNKWSSEQTYQISMLVIYLFKSILWAMHQMNMFILPLTLSVVNAESLLSTVTRSTCTLRITQLTLRFVENRRPTVILRTYWYPRRSNLDVFHIAMLATKASKMSYSKISDIFAVHSRWRMQKLEKMKVTRNPLGGGAESAPPVFHKQLLNASSQRRQTCSTLLYVHHYYIFPKKKIK